MERPTDCVHLAVTGLLDDLPDMVISGINHGANMGDDTIYSGTVAAATEGYLLGIPSIAVSLTSKTGHHFETAAKVVVDLISRHRRKPSGAWLLNVNVPDVRRPPTSRVCASRVWASGTRQSRWSRRRRRAARRATGSARRAPPPMPAKEPIFMRSDWASFR